MSKSKTKSRFNDSLPEILSPMYDLIFKLIFAKMPELLKSLLKSITGLTDEELEGDIVVDPHVYPEREGGKMGVMDIKVVLKSKEVIDVEMQRKKFAHMRERIVSYFSGAVREQMSSGDGYEKIKRVITITIMGEPLITDDDVYHHRYTLYDPKTQSEFTDLVEVHIIELSKLPKDDDGSELWWWMKYITVERKEQLKMIAEKSPVLEKATLRLLELSEDEKTRIRLESIRRYEMDNRVLLKEAKAEGIEIGLEKGREEGLGEGMEKGMEKVISLIKNGVSLGEIEKLLLEKQTPSGSS